MYRTLDPNTGRLLERFDLHDDTFVQSALGRAASTYREWARTPVGDRAELLRSVAGLLERQAHELADLMAVEMGKPLQQGIGEAEKCAWVCRYYADHAAEFLEPRAAPSDGSEARVRHDPIGPVLAIMPWNFPFWQLFRFGAPAIVAGNTVLLKHAPNTPRCGRRIESLLRDAGAPEGLLQNLFLDNDQVARLVGAPELRGVTLTGSSRAGSAVASRAGDALKRMVAELGGSDPFVVFADADLERAVETAVQARCLNNGQSCIAAKRFLVERTVHEPFLEAFVEGMRDLRVGDPRAAGTDIGPLAREDLRDTLAEQVRRSREVGARVLLGGEVPDGPGFHYPPTVLVNVPAGAPAARDELFGPVAPVFPFDDEGEALAMANGTRYGLGASLWTSDRERAERLVARIEAGSVFVNGMVKSDPRLPFGGVKDSGWGRELAREGIMEFVNVKTVWIA